jgi:hypothetical protein
MRAHVSVHASVGGRACVCVCLCISVLCGWTVGRLDKWFVNQQLTPSNLLSNLFGVGRIEIQQGVFPHWPGSIGFGAVMDAPAHLMPCLLVPALADGGFMAAATVAALSSRQREVSGLVAELHKCPDKPARRAVLGRIADEAVRGEVEAVFLAQWRRLKDHG